ncbi:SIMPL domain-containing protein [Treponema brennaborense]|uniref:26 kDa periplasmic immunogenic protein n=1 Tax=Treponema brennaborense (strain DSM 12168 / CIP 105900 / DD5/3) TaxID=906968 RepID=F4LL08_TREBD|nr:SIMPL domain-containing protein [Treponema brennaborense]AEE16605.1 protein of unknown function DUF541 [Treponema brennaborense DSM 12168]
MNKKILPYFFCIPCAVFLLGACTARQPSAAPRTVSVTGSGAVSVLPDTATIQLSVVTRDGSVTAAASENAKLMAQVQDAIQAAGISKDSFSTSNYNIYRENTYSDGKSIPGEYRVSNMLTVTVTEITAAGNIIDAAIRAGANELSSLSFSASDTEEAVQEARKLAVVQAQQAARLLAESSGAKLGKILTIAEESYNQPLYLSNRKLMASDAAGVTPVSAGKTDITVTVRSVYELE